MINLIGFSEEKLKQLFADWNVPSYRVQQVFSWRACCRPLRIQPFSLDSTASLTLPNGPQDDLCWPRVNAVGKETFSTETGGTRHAVESIS